MMNLFIANLLAFCLINTIFFLEGKAQFIHCSEAQFFNSTTQTCESCSSSCLYCSSSGETSCYSCKDGFFLYNSTCVSSCPTGFISDLTNRKCSPCLSNCASCPSDWFKYKTYCLEKCPQGTTQNNNECTVPSLAMSSIPIIIPLFVQGSIVPIYKTFTLNPVVEQKETTIFLWTANDTSIINGVAVNFKILNIPPENLITGTSYRLTLSATNSYGTTKATFDFTTGGSFVGSLSISPISDIIAMVTQLTFSMSGFETNEPFFYDVIVTYGAINSQERIISAKRLGIELNLVNSVVLAKGLARFQTIQSLRLPPIDVDRTATFWLFVYNGQKFTTYSQQARIKKQTQSQLSTISSIEAVSTIGDLVVSAEALNLLSPTNSYIICSRFSQATELARFFSGDQFCDPLECSNNGQCILEGSNHKCQCIGSFVGKCCGIDSNTLVGLKSGRNLYSVINSQLSTFRINAANAGFIAFAANSLAKNVEFLSLSDVNNLIESIYAFQSNTQFLDMFIAPKLFGAINNIVNFAKDKFTDTEWKNKLNSLNNLRNTLITSLVKNLEFKEKVKFLEKQEGFDAKKDTSSLLWSSSARILQKNILPSTSLLDIKIDLTSSVLILPSFTLTSETILSSVAFTSSISLITSDLTSYSVGLLVQDSNENAVSDLMEKEIQVVVRKTIASNATFSGLWVCAQNVDDIYTTSGCRKISENFTHVLCGCTMENKQIEITATLNRGSGYLTKQCVLESFQIYQPEADFSFVSPITDGKCFPFHFSLNGLFFLLIVFIGIILPYNLIVYVVNRNFDPTKPYNEKLSFIPLYSIFKAPSLPYDSRFIRANYFVCHVLDILGTATVNREQAWTLGINYWVQVYTTGLFIIFTLQYGTAALWNYLYRLEFGPDFQTKKVPQRARKIIIILCWIFWICYFIARWGVNSWGEQRFRLLGGLALLGADLLILDPLIAFLCCKIKFLREFVKYRGYYTPYSAANVAYGTNFGENAEPVPVSDSTSARDFREVRDASIRSTSRIKEYKIVGDPTTPAFEPNNMKEIIAELENRA